MLVRTTLQPTKVIDVDAREVWRLSHLGVLVGDWRTLYANFFVVPGGPPDDVVTGLSVSVRNSANTVVLTASGSSIEDIGTGVWLYRVPQSTTLPAGTYTVTWTGTDSDAEQVTATETVEVS